MRSIKSSSTLVWILSSFCARRRKGGWCYKTFSSKRETLWSTVKKPKETTVDIGAKTHLKPKTIPNFWESRSVFYRWLGREFNAASPTENIPAPRFSKAETESLQPAEVQARRRSHRAARRVGHSARQASRRPSGRRGILSIRHHGLLLQNSRHGGKETFGPLMWRSRLLAKPNRIGTHDPRIMSASLDRATKHSQSH